MAAEYLDNDDVWEISCTIQKLSQELEKEHGYISGGYFVSDDFDYFYVGKPGEVIRSLTETVHEMACAQEIEIPESDLEKRDGVHSGKGAPIWVLCGNFNPNNPIDACEALLATYHNDKEACYGEIGIYLDDAAVRALLKYYTKVHTKKEPYGDGSTPDEEITRTFKRLFGNVECLKKMGYKANNPQETFRNLVSAASFVRSRPEIETYTESFSQYIDMVLALQEVMYKDPSNIQWGGIADPYRLNMDILYEGEARLTGTNIAVLEIPKARIKVEVYPMTLKVTSIK